jgi:hypothetical protein
MANFNIDYLVVAGGGGGGPGYQAGGGGGGGLRTSYGASSGGGSSNENQLTLTLSTSYTVTVGNGGAGGAAISADSTEKGDNGDNSVFHTITSIGGGGGASYYNVPSSGLTGGSGGGAGNRFGNPNQSGGAGTANQGYAGGGTTTYSDPYSGGGGGGAASAGDSGGALGALGNGGNGLEVNIVGGTGNYYAGGGGAGVYSNGSIPTGGSGGGGVGSRGGYSNVTTPGVGSSGLGGGGGGAGSNNVAGGDGGSGIVILRYATADITSYTATGITPTKTTDGTDTILSFTTVGTGTITFTPPPFSGTKVTTPVTDFNKLNTEEGLKIPSGTSLNQPTGVEGMVRNDTTQSSKGSSSAITYYNGTNWKYFENELNTSFNTVLYTGDDTSSRDIGGVGFQPDLVWVKNRTGANNHVLVDSVRGASKLIFSDSSAAELTTNTTLLSSINSDGFTVGYDGTDVTNGANNNYVAWCFKAGGLINKAADFNGSSSYVDIGGNLVNNLTSITLSAWVYTDSNTQYSYVMHVGYVGTAGEAFSISRWNNTASSGYDAYTVYANLGGGNIDGNYVLNENTWYHVAVTWTGTTIKFYVNGNLTTTATTSSLSIPASGNSGYIGRYIDNQSYNWKGKINQARIFNSALSSSQITQLYNETKADNSVLNYPSGAGCIAAYPLGENANGVDGLYNGTASNVTFGKPGYLTRNNEGTIESTVSVNNELAFSIVSYTGNLSGATTATGQSVGHGMDVSPELIIFKSTSNSTDWNVFSSELDNWSTRLELNDTVTKNDLYSQYPIANPTSNVFYTNYLSAVNVNNYNYIAYCFTSKPNYSKVGSYLGNGNTTGPVVTLGFEPAWVMIKGVDEVSGWTMLDNKRDTSNPNSARLDADDSMAEYNGVNLMDFNSDGFQLKTSSAGQNALNKTFIYLAFANTI